MKLLKPIKLDSIQTCRFNETLKPKECYLFFKIENFMKLLTPGRFRTTQTCEIHKIVTTQRILAISKNV